MAVGNFPVRVAAIAAAIGVSLGNAGALPFVDLFEKDLGNVPPTAELRKQEDEARAKLNAALELESRGRSGKALDAHRDVVKKYPLTTAASMSQFKVGELRRAEGNSSKAFDAFQLFIENYKSSSAFTEAVRNQYEIAQAGQSGEVKGRVFGFVPRKVQNSELLEWYGKIITNAPYTDFAPLSQFAIAEIYVDQEKEAEAIRAYQALVDKWPRHPKAAEAQYRIGAIGKSAVEDGSQDLAKIRSARGAMEDVLVAYQDSERAAEAREALLQFDAVEAEKMLKVGKFYEKQKKYRSAAVYYRKVAANTGTPSAQEAQTRLDEILAKAPAANTPAEPTSTAAPTRPTPLRDLAGAASNAASNAAGNVASAASNVASAAGDAAAKVRGPKPLLKARSNYVGPPAPDLKIVDNRPKMRTNPASLPIVPPAPDPDPASETPPLPPAPKEKDEVAADVAVSLPDTPTPPPPAPTPPAPPTPKPEPKPEPEPVSITAPPPSDPDDDGFLALPPPPEPEEDDTEAN